MLTAHRHDVLRRPTSRTREILSIALALPATLLTLATLWGILDLASATYVDAEVVTGQVVVLAASLLTILAWAGVIALHRSARRELHSGPRRLLLAGVIAAAGFSTLAMVGGPGWMSVGAVALAVLAAVAALVAAVRT